MRAVCILKQTYVVAFYIEFTIFFGFGMIQQNYKIA